MTEISKFPGLGEFKGIFAIEDREGLVVNAATDS